jgi:type IV pilus assembly protein PilV
MLLKNLGITAKEQQGASLIEVLVAIVIFSIGMLGAAGLQLSSMRTSQYTSKSSIAANAAQEYSEIMQGTSVQSTLVATFDSQSAPSAPSTVCIGAAANCTSEQLFFYSQYDWWKRLESALPGGRVVVCQDIATRDTSAQLTWSCDADGSAWVVKVSWITKEKTTTGEVFTTNDGTPKFVMQIFGRAQKIGV